MMSDKDPNRVPDMEQEKFDDIVTPGEKSQIFADKLASIKRTELTSIAPDDIDWNNIYFGKDQGLHSIKPPTESRRKHPL